MIKEFFTRNFGLFIQDSIKGTNIRGALKELLVTEKKNIEYLDNYKLQKLKKLINHAYLNVPYYTKLFNAINLKPSDISSIEDLEKIPVLTKEIARVNQEKLIATNFKDFKINYGKTGGTTGVPLETQIDQINRSYTWASYYRWYRWIGIKFGEKAMTLWGSKTILKKNKSADFIKSVKDYILNDKTIDTFNINKQSIPNVYNNIIKENPVLIKGYLSAIIILAQYMKDNKLPANNKLKAISSTTETLLPIYRELIENVFKVPVFDQYGCGEVSAISYQCKQNQALHINEEHVILEILDENNKSIRNKKGKIVVTGLDNFIMPFIRFENGDMSSLLDETCKCGLPHRLMGSIEGRTIDTIELLNGAKVHGVFFTDILFELGITTDMIGRFQIVQKTSGAIDFYIESNIEIPLETTKKLEKSVSRFIKLDNIIVTDFIPNEPNGKFKYIKSER